MHDFFTAERSRDVFDVSPSRSRSKARPADRNRDPEIIFRMDELVRAHVQRDKYGFGRNLGGDLGEPRALQACGIPAFFVLCIRPAELGNFGKVLTGIAGIPDR